MSKCEVCTGSRDAYMEENFPVPVCEGCRIFFRNVLRYNTENTLKIGDECDAVGHCFQDMIQLSGCERCRFAKCKSVGLKEDMFEFATSVFSKLDKEGGNVSRQGMLEGADKVDPEDLCIPADDTDLEDVPKWSKDDQKLMAETGALRDYLAHLDAAKIKDRYAGYPTTERTGSTKQVPFLTLSKMGNDEEPSSDIPEPEMPTAVKEIVDALLHAHGTMLIENGGVMGKTVFFDVRKHPAIDNMLQRLDAVLSENSMPKGSHARGNVFRYICDRVGCVPLTLANHVKAALVRAKPNVS